MRQDVRTTTRERLLAGAPMSERRYGARRRNPTAVLEGGAGPPIVVLHAEGEFAALWTTVIPDLVHTHRVIAPDLPGHGESGATGPLDVATCGRLGGRARRADLHRPADTSSGGASARRSRPGWPSPTGDGSPELVLTTALGLAEFAPAPSFAAAVDGFSAQPSARTRDLMFAQCFADLDGLRRRMGERWEPIADYALERFGTPQMQAAMAGLVPAFMPPIPAAELRGIAVPTTLIWGRRTCTCRWRSPRRRIAATAGHCT